MINEDQEPRSEALELAIRLVDHLGQTGAEECLLPVVDRAKEYIVRVAPKETFNKEQAELDAVRKANAVEESELCEKIDAYEAKCAELEKLLTRFTHHQVMDNSEETGESLRVAARKLLTPAPPEEKRP